MRFLADLLCPNRQKGEEFSLKAKGAIVALLPIDALQRNSEQTIRLLRLYKITL